MSKLPIVQLDAPTAASELEYDRWDQQLEQNVANGKLEALAEEAIAEFKAGHCREI